MKKSSIFFCIGSLLVFVILSLLTFPMVSMTEEELLRAQTPKPAESFTSIDLGEFGKVSVMELMDYYITNPPSGSLGTYLKKKKKDHGC
jgi:hypothetical protein